MDKFPFLANARLGEGHYRYIITFLLVIFGSGLVGHILIGILSVTPLNSFIHPPSNINFINVLDSDSVIYSLSMLLIMFLCMRFIHKRKFITLITSYRSVQWKLVLKGMIIIFFMLGLELIINYLLYPTDFSFTFDPSTFGLLVLASILESQYLLLVKKYFSVVISYKH